MAKWKIFYGDGATFSSDDGDIKDAPATNVQIIVQAHDDTGRYHQSGRDYYVHWEGEWLGVDIFGLFDFLMESGVVKFGRTVRSERFLEVYRRAEEDEDFPRRSAFKKGERRE